MVQEEEDGGGLGYGDSWGLRRSEEGYGRGLGFKNDTSGEGTFLVAYGPSN